MAQADPKIANQAFTTDNKNAEKPLKEIYEHINKKEFNKASKKIKKGLQSFVNTDFKSKVHGYLTVAAQNYNGLPDNKKKDLNNLLSENSPNFDDIKNNLAEGRQVEGAKAVEVKELTELNASFNNLINYVRSNFETLKNNNNINIEQVRSIFKSGVQGLEGVDRSKIKDAVVKGFENFDSMVKELNENLKNSTNMRDAPIYGKLKVFLGNIVSIYKESESEFTKLTDDLSPITSKRTFWEGRVSSNDRRIGKSSKTLERIKKDIDDFNGGLVNFTKFLDVFIEITEDLGKDKPFSKMLNKLFKLDLSDKDNFLRELQTLSDKVASNPINITVSASVSESIDEGEGKNVVRNLSNVTALFNSVKTEADKLQTKLKDLINSAAQVKQNDSNSLLKLLQDFKELSVEFNKMHSEIDGFVNRFERMLKEYIDDALNDFYLKFGQDVKGLNQKNKQQLLIIKQGNSQIAANMRNVIVPNINASDLEREKQNLLLRNEVDSTDWNKVSDNIERSKTLIGGIV